MYKSILLATSGLLAVASAQPIAGEQGKCIDGVQVDVIRFDTLETGDAVPNGYMGLQWDGVDVHKTPNTSQGGLPQSYIGTTPPNVVHATHHRYGGRMFRNGGRAATFGVRSFDAACFYPDTRFGAKDANCTFMFSGFNGDSSDPQSYDYTSSAALPEFTTFASNPLGGETLYQFYVTGPENERGEKPTLAIDNIVVDRPC